MAERRDALTELVRQNIGTGKRWSTRAFAEIAIDPDSGWSPSKSLLAKIIKGDNYDITAELVGALAVGLGLPREVVAAAGHYQLIGYDESELKNGAPATLLHKLGKRPEGTPKAAAIAEKWQAGEDVSP
ncbi:hypothetical protein [Streptomyces sp. NPDC005970]|uniref:hypothetical protein n=1 Tax=Streptomyces sp. NPDC005970 TaxID=3156723 RepID=UPI0033E1DEB4